MSIADDLALNLLPIHEIILALKIMKSLPNNECIVYFIFYFFSFWTWHTHFHWSGNCHACHYGKELRGKHSHCSSNSASFVYIFADAFSVCEFASKLVNLHNIITEFLRICTVGYVL